MLECRCITCDFVIVTQVQMQEHYNSEWHRYNVKRLVASFPAVSLKQFEERVQSFERSESLANAKRTTTWFCRICQKNFKTRKSYESHEQSKKHKDAVAANVRTLATEGIAADVVEERRREPRQHPADRAELNEKGKFFKKVDDEYELIEDGDDDDDDDAYEDIELEEVFDSDELDELAENPLTSVDCLFCEEKSADLAENLVHMSATHSFFIPDLEYCIDVEGLLDHLGTKVANYYVCLWCNERGKTFYTLDAVRKHMRDKGHCQMLHEGIALAEYVDFYDYSTTYPDHHEGMDIDEEYEPELLDGDGDRMVLPSGTVISHRLLMRKNRQRYNAERAVVPLAVTAGKDEKQKLHRVLNHYRELGMSKTDQKAAARNARDMHVMKRLQSKWQMKLGCKANKLQKHYRAQVLM